MATVNLGSIKFNWQGAYDNATAYAVDDVVSSGGNSYICIAATTGNTPPNATYWELMAQAGTNGTNGTDLTSTLTTQGDILYRDGSGLQRLGAGVAGQVLQTGGAGANPSWGTVSSDFVKLAEFSDTTSASTFQFDNYFSSTYDSYRIIFRCSSLSNGQNFLARVNTSTGTANSSSLYTYNGVGYYRGSASNSLNSLTGWNQTQFHWGYGSGDADFPTFGEIIIHNPLSSNYKIFTYNLGVWNGTGDFYTNIGSSQWSSSSTITGMTFYYDASNIIVKQLDLYGIK